MPGPPDRRPGAPMPGGERGVVRDVISIVR